MKSMIPSVSHPQRQVNVVDDVSTLWQEAGVEKGNKRRLWVIDGPDKEMVWKRMLRQAVIWPAIDLILCTLLIWPCHSGIEKPKWLQGLCSLTWAHCTDKTTMNLKMGWNTGPNRKGRTSEDTRQDSCFRPADKQQNPLERPVYRFIRGWRSHEACAIGSLVSKGFWLRYPLRSLRLKDYRLGYFI